MKRRVELVVDEMLAIRSEILVWKEKKASEEANARYNEVLNYGFVRNISPEASQNLRNVSEV